MVFCVFNFFEWYKGAMVFCILYFFCLELMVRKNTCIRTISIMIITLISKLSFWKWLDYSYVQNFSTIMRNTGSSIWKTSWRFYGHGSTYMLNLSQLKIMKWKLMKVDGKSSVVQKSKHVLWKELHQDISLVFVFFFLSDKPSF